MANLTRGQRNVAWIEQYCRVPEGRDVGKPVVLRDWQRKELLKIYDNPAKTRRAILSFGRKNGKSALAAFIVVLHLCGPEARQNSQIYSAAQSREQAAVVFGLAAKIIRMSPDLTGVMTIRDSRKELFCDELGVLYRALSADAATAYGLSPVLIIHDELGQVRGPRSALFEALETAVGAQDSPLSVVISTQAPNDGDLLSLLIDHALTKSDPRVVLSLYAAAADADPFSEESIRAANPAFGDFQNAEESMQMARDAREVPSREAEYRNLILNQRVEAQAPFISRSAWARCNGPVDPSKWTGPVYAGLDLSEAIDLTAFVLVSQVDGFWEVFPTFWLPSKGLAEKSRTDRVPYDMWHDEGYLQATPGPTVDYEFVAAEIYEATERFDLRKIAFDRFAMNMLRAHLRRTDMRPEQIDGDESIFHEFGQGFVSMSPALREVETLILNDRLAHGGHPVLSMCAANARVLRDPSGNRKLSKINRLARIDGLVAMTMALSVAVQDGDDDANFASFIESLR